MVSSCYISLHLSFLMYALSGVLYLVGTFGNVPSVACAAVSFLNISDNAFNDFTSSIPGDRKGEDGNGF